MDRAGGRQNAVDKTHYTKRFQQNAFNKKAFLTYCLSTKRRPVGWSVGVGWGVYGKGTHEQSWQVGQIHGLTPKNSFIALPFFHCPSFLSY